jgi:hypothetical protein
MSKSKFPLKIQVRRCFDCSTAHISNGDRQRLERAADLQRVRVFCGAALRASGKMRLDEDHLLVHDYREGFLVYCPGDEDMLQEDIETARDQLYTEDFIRLMRIAAANDCIYLWLDADGPIYEELPQYNWSDDDGPHALGNERVQDEIAEWILDRSREASDG